jgi:hypothetical protein
MDFARIAVVDQAAFFVVLAGWAELVIAAIAEPFFGV